MKLKYKISLILMLILASFMIMGVVSAESNITDNATTLTNNEDVSLANINDSSNSVTNPDNTNYYQETSDTTDTPNDTGSNTQNNVNTLSQSTDSNFADIADPNNIYISPNGTGTGTSSSPTNWTTAHANIADGGTIYFMSGTYTDIYNSYIYENITLSSYNNANVIINPQQKGFIFNIQNSNVKLIGLTLTNGTGYHEGGSFIGGSIHAKNTNLTLINSTIKNNHVTFGGAIWISGNMVISGSTFFNNSADEQGGAIFTDIGNMTVIDSSFIKNVAGKFEGGAIRIGIGNLNVSNSVFIDNDGLRGGAIELFNGNGNISACSFINNTAYVGGAINSVTLNLNVIDSSFINNNATKYGGAIYTDTANCNIYGSSFIDNSASLCGIYTNKGNVYVSNSNFTDKQKIDDAIIGVSGNGTVINSSFFNSSCQAISIVGYASVINSTFFNNNLGSENGLIVIRKGNISGCSFINNTAYSGGTIYIYDYNGTPVNVSGCSFIKNTAKFGGAIFTLNNRLYVSNSSFINNTAEKGGAISMFYGAIINVSSSSFINNTATRYGGVFAMENNNNSILVSGSSFIDNNATLGGNVIFCNSLPNYTWIPYNWWGNNTPFTEGNNLIFYGSAHYTVSNWIIMGLTLSSNSIAPGGSSVLVASLNQVNTTSGDISSLPSDITLPVRTVIFSTTDGNLNPSSADISNLASSTYSSTISGNHVLSATIDNMTLYVNINVNTPTPPPTPTPTTISTSISGSDMILTVEETGKFSVTLTDKDGNLLSGKTVTFSVNGQTFTNKTVNGIASIDVKGLDVGTYTINYNFDKSGNYLASNGSNTIKINSNSSNTTNSTKVNTTISGININFAEGNNATFTATLKDSNGNLLNDKLVTFFINGKTYTSNTINGLATITLTNLKAGTYAITYTFNGDDNYTGSSNENTVIVTAPGIAPGIYGNNLTEVYGTHQNYTGKLIDINGNPMIGQHVALKLSRSNGQSKVYWVTTDTLGEYQLEINLSPGAYTAEASYGDYVCNNTISVTKEGENRTGVVLTVDKFSQPYGAGANFTGTLKDTSDNLLVGQHIAVNLTRLSNGASKVYWVTTDTDGAFQLQINLGLGEYTATCSYAGTTKYQPNTASNTISVTNS